MKWELEGYDAPAREGNPNMKTYKQLVINGQVRDLMKTPDAPAQNVTQPVPFASQRAVTRINLRGVGQAGRELVRPLEQAVTNPFKFTFRYLKEDADRILLESLHFTGGLLGGVFAAIAVGMAGTSGVGPAFVQAAFNLPYFLNIPAGLGLAAVGGGLGAVAGYAAVKIATPITVFAATAFYQAPKGFVQGLKESIANLKKIALTKEVSVDADKPYVSKTSFLSKIKDDARSVMQAITQKLVRMTMPDVELVEKTELQKLVHVFEQKAGAPLQLPAPQIDHLADYLQAQLGGLPLDARVKILNEKIVPAVSAHLDGANAAILLQGQMQIADTQADIDRQLESLREISSRAAVTATAIERELKPDPLGDRLLGRDEPKPVTPRP